jgi:hypothetical protein
MANYLGRCGRLPTCKKSPCPIATGIYLFGWMENRRAPDRVADTRRQETGQRSNPDRMEHQKRPRSATVIWRGNRSTAVWYAASVIRTRCPRTGGDAPSTGPNVSTRDEMHALGFGLG